VAYFYVRLIPQDSLALHLELFTVPSPSPTFWEVVTSHGFVKSPSRRRAGISQAQAALRFMIRQLKQAFTKP
jgi:hypothetical protein